MIEGKGLAALRGFAKAARGRSQEEIIIAFLDSILNAEHLADSGSVLINHARYKKLVLFNEGDFLFSRHILDARARDKWPKEFSHYEGVAGRCFREATTKIYRKSTSKASAGASEFSGDSPIENMICIPIITMAGPPFGIACFHNNDASRAFTDEQVELLESYVEFLGLALHTPHPELQLEHNVFVVHGRDLIALRDLENILFKYGAKPKVLADDEKNAQTILQSLEELIRVCKAGFILVTPDDEGRLAGSGENLVSRARENVIFETGLLFAKYREFKRVVLLVKDPAKLPSDLSGVAYERFSAISDIEARIAEKLRGWGINKP